MTSEQQLSDDSECVVFFTVVREREGEQVNRPSLDGAISEENEENTVQNEKKEKKTTNTHTHPETVYLAVGHAPYGRWGGVSFGDDVLCKK